MTVFVLSLYHDERKRMKRMTALVSIARAVGRGGRWISSYERYFVVSGRRRFQNVSHRTRSHKRPVSHATPCLTPGAAAAHACFSCRCCHLLAAPPAPFPPARYAATLRTCWLCTGTLRFRISACTRALLPATLTAKRRCAVVKDGGCCRACTGALCASDAISSDGCVSTDYATGAARASSAMALPVRGCHACACAVRSSISFCRGGKEWCCIHYSMNSN